MASKKRKTTHPMIAALERILATSRLTNAQVGDAIGATESGVRLCRRTGRPPKNRLVQDALAKFIETSEAAIKARLVKVSK